MGTDKTKNGNGKKSTRVWTQQDSAEFAEHLAERGFTIVRADQMAQQNQFITQVTQGLNVSDPANEGRSIAVVWKDHLELLNTIAKCVLALGIEQAKMEAAQDAADLVAIDATAIELQKARDIIESLGDHLADKEKKAQDAVRYFGTDGKEAPAPEPIST